LGYNLSCSNCSSFGHWELFGWWLHPFDMLLLLWFSCTFLYFPYKRCSRIIIYFSCPRPKISHFSKEPRFLLLENRIRNQDLGAGCDCWYLNVAAFSSSQLTEWRTVHVYIYWYNINISILFIAIYLSISILKINVSSDWCFQL
jgi:hypothetical protein